MGAIVVNSRFVYGIVEPKPLRGAPEGARVRLRLRPKAFAFAFVRHNGEARQYAIKEEGGEWLIDPEFEQGRNITVSRQ